MRAPAAFAEPHGHRRVMPQIRNGGKSKGRPALLG
jgi:hypothetical protein